MERKRTDSIEQVFEDDGSEEAIIEADDTGMVGEERQVVATEIAEALNNDVDEGSESHPT